MEGGVLLTKEFNEFSKNYVMFLHVTTRIEGRKNDDLLARSGGTGFPSFMMLDTDGSVLARHATARTVENFDATAKRAGEFIDLRAKAKTGDKDAMIRFTLARARLGQFKQSEFEAAMKPFGRLAPEHEKAYKGVLANLMYKQIQATALGKKFAAMAHKGLIPSDKRSQGSFYFTLWNYANYIEDVKLMELAYNGLAKVHADNPRAAGFLRSAKAQLAKAKNPPK